MSIYPSCEVVLILSDLKEFFSISMSDFREALWKNNADLKEALLKYVVQGLQRSEMLDFLTRDFPLLYFDIFFIDGAVKVDHVMIRHLKLSQTGLESYWDTTQCTKK